MKPHKKKRQPRKAEPREAHNRILQSAMAAGSEEQLGQSCLRVAEQLTGGTMGFMGETGPDGLLHLIAISEPGWAACRMVDKADRRKPLAGFPIHGIFAPVLADGKGLIANDLADHPGRISLPKGHPPVVSFLGVPLMREGKAVGIVAVANREGGFRPEDQEALEYIAPAIVEALDRKRAEEALRELNARLEDSVRQRTAELEQRSAQLRELASKLTLLFQSVRELLFNAAKHAKVRPASVDVKCADGQIRLVVSDNGEGFDPARLRAQGGRSSGFGLLSIRERLSLMGGRMEIVSAPGKGSTFTLWAPLGGGREQGMTGGQEEGRTGGQQEGRNGGLEEGRTGGQEEGRTGGQEEGKMGGREGRRESGECEVACNQTFPSTGSHSDDRTKSSACPDFWKVGTGTTFRHSRAPVRAGDAQIQRRRWTRLVCPSGTPFVLSSRPPLLPSSSHCFLRSPSRPLLPSSPLPFSLSSPPELPHFGLDAAGALAASGAPGL
ncbi:MAG: GAF domain-containing protein [Phycisphaerae bacterium]